MSTINTVGMSPNWPLIRQMVDEGFINTRPSAEFPELTIYNYSAKAQYDKVWNEATLMCRGLIAEGERVLARPFSKFFNHTEHALESLPLHLEYRVWEKLDGSLGISYVHQGKVRISTRGSMDSDQAVFATNYLAAHYPDWMPKGNHTYLFEIIYPENRIVVDYGDKAGLVLLAILDTETGAEVDDEHVWRLAPFETVDYIGNSMDLSSLQDRENKEGYVLAFENGFRVKIKHGEYIRLHHIITGASTKMIWEYMREGRDFEALISSIPDELYSWIGDQRRDLQSQYDELEKGCAEIFKGKPDTDNRGEIAKHFKPHGKLASVLFMMLDNSDYSDMIWKMVKPEESVFYMDDTA